MNSEHLEVEESINCQRDALTLTALAPNKKQIGRFCGEKGTIQQEIKSDANDVIIVFKQGLHLKIVLCFRSFRTRLLCFERQSTMLKCKSNTKQRFGWKFHRFSASVYNRTA